MLDCGLSALFMDQENPNTKETRVNILTFIVVEELKQILQDLVNISLPVQESDPLLWPL